MAGIGALTLDSAGSVTAPTALPFSLPSANATRVSNHALCSMAVMPAERGVMWANGVDPLRHYVETVLGTGLLAPKTAITATPTGAAATTMLDASGGTIGDGDRIALINSLSYIYFRATLSASPLFDEVYKGSSDTTALANLAKFINGTGVDGVDYKYATGTNVFAAYVTAGTPNANDLTLTSIATGTVGNSYVCTYTGGAGVQFEPAGGGAPQTTFSGGSAGTSADLGPGTYQYAYAYVRDDDGAISGLSPSDEATTQDSLRIDTSGMVASADAAVDWNRIYRTTAGGGRFYRVDEVAAATTTFNDTVTDDTITQFGASAYDERLYRSYRAGFPPKGRYLAVYRGRYFTGGALLSATYTAGTAAVNADATTVTITNGYPRTSWVGRKVQFTTSETYRIMSVSESAKTFEIDRGLEGGSNLSGVAYTVTDDRDPYEVFWSEPGLPNNWPVTNSLKGVISKDGKGITGLYAAFESLIVFTRQAVWRLAGTGPVFTVSLVTDKCGCISGHTVVMDGDRMYWLGADGVYGWDGSSEPVSLSSPPSTEGATRGIDDTIGRLSLAYAHRAVGIHDEHDDEIRWHLPLDVEATNRYALVLDLQSGAFSLDTCEDVTWAAIVQGHEGDDHSITGDIQGAIMETALSNSDGAFGLEPTNTVSSSTVRTVTVATTPFPTSGNGLVAVPVWHFASDGTPTRACVASNTNQVLTYRRYMTAPSASTQFSVGGILLWLQTGRFDLGERRVRKRIAGSTVGFSPDSDGQAWFFFAYDQGDFSLPTRGHTSIDLTSTLARRRFIVAKYAMLHGWGIAAVEPGCDPTFSAVTLEAAPWTEADL